MLSIGNMNIRYGIVFFYESDFNYTYSNCSNNTFVNVFKTLLTLFKKWSLLYACRKYNVVITELDKYILFKSSRKRRMFVCVT